MNNKQQDEKELKLENYKKEAETDLIEIKSIIKRMKKTKQKFLLNLFFMVVLSYGIQIIGNTIVPEIKNLGIITSMFLIVQWLIDCIEY